MEAAWAATVSLVVVGAALVFAKAKSSVTGETGAGGGVSTEVLVVDREVSVVAEVGHGVGRPYKDVLQLLLAETLDVVVECFSKVREGGVAIVGKGWLHTD